mgnify:CR=1 FL=1
MQYILSTARSVIQTHQMPSRLYRSGNLSLAIPFTSKYKCFYLIYYEHFNYIKDAIKKEKQIKGWLRIKKEKLINEFNPEWKFLNYEI